MNRTPIRQWFSCVLCLWVFAFYAKSAAWGVISGDASMEAEKLLQTARKKAAEDLWSDAVESIQKVIEKHGSKLIEVKISPDQSKHFINARTAAETLLFEMGSPAANAYRKRFGSVAENKFSRAEKEDNLEQMQVVGENFFASDVGEKAWEFVGGRAFQAGDMNRAQWAFGKLFHRGPSDTFRVRHFRPTIDTATAAAKIILIMIARGDWESARNARSQFESQFSNAAGALAGRRGPLGEILDAAMNHDGFNEMKITSGNRFGATPQRTNYHEGIVGELQFLWRDDLPRPIVQCGEYSAPEFARPAAPETPPPAPLPYFASVSAGRVWVNDEQRIKSYPLQAAHSVSANPNPRVWGVDGTQPSTGFARANSTLPQFSLDVGEKIGVVRLGPSQEREMPTNEQWKSELAGFDAEAQSTDPEFANDWLWKRSAGDVLQNSKAKQKESDQDFEGTPLMVDDTVYTTIVGMHANSAPVTSYAAALDARSGRTKWIKWIATSYGGGSETATKDAPLITYEPKSRTLYYQTDTGALAAIDAQDGSVIWLTQYAPAHQEEWQKKKVPMRAPRAPIFSDGLLLLTAIDVTNVMAFDATTGIKVWAKGAPEFPEYEVRTHVLGVRKGKLLLSTGSAVYALDIKTGDPAFRYPKGGSPAEEVGQGIIVGDQVLWPTKEGIHFVNADTGNRNRLFTPAALGGTDGKGGNLGFGNGYLTVTNSNSITVFGTANEIAERELIGTNR